MKTNADIKRQLEQITDENERLKYFQNLVKEFNKEEYLNNRKHTRNEKRHSFNITDMDDYDPDNMDTYIPPMLIDLCKPKDWDDIIFSTSADGLPDLVTDRALWNIIKQLKTAQKDVFYYRVIKGYAAKEIASLQGVSERNVRKLFEKALHNIREAYLPVIKFKHKLETGEKYKEIARELDIYTTAAERGYADKCERLSEEKEKIA